MDFYLLLYNLDGCPKNRLKHLSQSNQIVSVDLKSIFVYFFQDAKLFSLQLFRVRFLLYLIVSIF